MKKVSMSENVHAWAIYVCENSNSYGYCALYIVYVRTNSFTHKLANVFFFSLERCI